MEGPGASQDWRMSWTFKPKLIERAEGGLPVFRDAVAIRFTACPGDMAANQVTAFMVERQEVPMDDFAIDETSRPLLVEIFGEKRVTDWEEKLRQAASALAAQGAVPRTIPAPAETAPAVEETAEPTPSEATPAVVQETAPPEVVAEVPVPVPATPAAQPDPELMVQLVGAMKYISERLDALAVDVSSLQARSALPAPSQEEAGQPTGQYVYAPAEPVRRATGDSVVAANVTPTKSPFENPEFTTGLKK
jgi:hypothetical protein